MPIRFVFTLLSLFFSIVVPAYARDPEGTGSSGGGGGGGGGKNEIEVDEKALKFEIPTFSDILTFGIRAFFVVAGIMALFYLLMGALAWVTSGGNKENVEKAQQKIQQAIVGVILIAVVLAIIVTLEQVVFKKAVCFGVSCGVTVPALLKKT